MKTKHFGLNLIKSDTKTLLKSYRIPLILISILMGVLLFVMNVFLAGALYGNSFNLQMKEKLGVYLYLSDAATQDHTDAALKSALEEKGL